MKTRFIDFEGVNGSGKSVCASRLYDNLSQTENVKVYFEYGLDVSEENPCDIRMTAVLSKEELEAVIGDYPFDEKLIRENVKVYNDWNCIFMPKVSHKNSLYFDLNRYVVCNGRTNPKRFIEALLGKIKAFVEEALVNDTIYIFKNVIFDQVLTELMRMMACSEAQMIECIMRIESLLAPLNPTIFYLCVDNLERQIDKVALERVSEDYALYPDWIEWMILNLQQSKYGQVRNVTTKADLIKYFDERIQIEEKCLECLNANHKERITIDTIDYNIEDEYILEKYRA